MKILKFNKFQKKIKVIKNKNILQISGPLGIIEYKLKDIQFENCDFFIKKTEMNFFINKIKQLFKSVSTGWYVELNLNGIGYKSFKLDDKIAFDLGYSNLIIYKPTDLLRIKNLKNKILLFGINQEYLNNVAINLRNYSFPDQYKGKGILFKNEKLKLKKKI